MRIILYAFLFVLLGFQKISADTFRSIESERINKRDSLLSIITEAKISDNIISITDFGAIGDGVRNDKPAFDKAMQSAAKQGGAHIIVPSGTFLLKGPIHFVSNVCLELMDGAIIKFDSNPKYYLPLVKTSWEGTFLYNYSPFIYGYNLHDISIVGKGKIDGNASSTFATWKSKQKEGQALSRKMNHEEIPIELRRFGNGFWLRPQLIQFYNCKNITLSDVFITNSPFWCIHLLKSENVICRSLRYDAKLVNNDGIDPECSRNILIENIEFNNGDDNIAIKSGRDNDGWASTMPSENIIIRNCRFKGLHAVVLGSEMSSGVQNIFVENCTYGGYCKRGIYIKTNPDRGGFIKNLYVKNCRFDEVEDLFYVTSMYAGEGLNNIHYTDVKNIYVDSLFCRKVRKAGLVLQGTSRKPISDVIFSNVEIQEVDNAVSFDNTLNVEMRSCHIGGRVGVPSQASSADKLFVK